jgi:hypothetical protein
MGTETTATAGTAEPTLKAVVEGSQPVPARPPKPGKRGVARGAGGKFTAKTPAAETVTTVTETAPAAAPTAKKWLWYGAGLAVLLGLYWLTRPKATAATAEDRREDERAPGGKAGRVSYFGVTNG